MNAHETFNDFIKEIESKRPHKTYSDFVDAIEGDDDAQAIILDDNLSFEKQWAEAIDQALADAAIEAFKNNIRDCIASVLKQDEVSDRHLKWLRAQMNKKIDILDKIVHLSKTEDVTHEEHGDDSRREAEEEH